MKILYVNTEEQHVNIKQVAFIISSNLLATSSKFVWYKFMVSIKPGGRLAGPTFFTQS